MAGDAAPALQFTLAPQSECPWVILMADQGEAEAARSACEDLGLRDFALAVCADFDWNRDLSPWAAPPVFKRGEAFSGGADAMLDHLTGELLSKLTASAAFPPARLILAGYSLAGLFALYAGTRCDAFDGLISASGSLWYPNWRDYAERHPFKPSVRSVYLSLGDREAKTRNTVMQSVEANTEALAQRCESAAIRTKFELNPGGHFADVGERLAKGIAWTIARKFPQIQQENKTAY